MVMEMERDTPPLGSSDSDSTSVSSWPLMISSMSIILTVFGIDMDIVAIESQHPMMDHEGELELDLEPDADAAWPHHH